MSMNPLHPAIRQAIETAILQTPAGPCEACGKQPARPYAFAYAQEMASSSGTVHGGGTVTTTTYGPVAARGVNICDSCIEAYKRPRLASQRRPVIGTAIAVALLAVLGIALPAWRETLLALAGFGSLIVLVMSMKGRELARSPRLAGSLVALSLHESDLKQRRLTSWPDLEMYN